MNIVTMKSLPHLSEPMQGALSLSSGARFYRCALQVNPFAYLNRYNKRTPFKSETEYNTAIVNACLDNEIEVIAVTDHYRVEDSWTLIRNARDAGIAAFGGFEAVTKDGVHILCIFNPEKDDILERLIGECGVHDPKEASPTGSLDSIELLEHAKKWGAVCIAAHVTTNGGLLEKLSGQTRINVWNSSNLLACAISVPIDDIPEGMKQILKNKDSQHKRIRPLAVITASDIDDPSNLNTNSASCFIKMSDVSVEGFRQAFLDPESRIRLCSDQQPDPHVELVAITWEGGFLRDTGIHFNGNLNTVVGGRGAGKSTMIESIRYVLGLDPIGEDARKAHEGVIRDVLRSGTKVSLVVSSPKPTERSYVIERSVPNPPVVKDEHGEVLSVSPRDIIPGVEVFGQHEISELTKSPEKLTLLLERFVDRDTSANDRKVKVRWALEKSRNRIMDLRHEIDRVEERLTALPGLEETEKRFKQAGLEDRLKEKSLLIKEERLFSILEEKLQLFRTLRDQIIENLPIDTAFVSSKSLNVMPNAHTLVEIEKVLDTLSASLKMVCGQYEEALLVAENSIGNIRSRWDEQRKTIEETYENLLRELQKANIDGGEFIQLRKQIEELQPLKERINVLKRELTTHEEHRRKLLNEWDDIKAVEYRQLDSAARRVSNELRGRVQVDVKMAGNRMPLEQLLREVGGNLAAAIERIRQRDQLSLSEFAAHCRAGKDDLMNYYGFPSGAAERIANAELDIYMKIEELDLPATTCINLNIAADNATPVWQALSALSTGQKATAVLLLLLLESEAPLVIDQPEDDLDNRFITEGVVPIMRREKRRRQFIFSTHNANIPVLGDAELILGLDATGEAKEGQAKIAPNHMGSIDSEPVRELVEEILEGGKAAFEIRRSKYGF